jgi:hypothetical protein
MNQSPGPGSFPKNILIHGKLITDIFHPQDAISDAQVSPLGAQNMARAYKCSTVAPQTRQIFGVTEKTGSFNGSAIVEWKYDDVPDAPTIDIAPSKSTGNISLA